MNGETAPKRTDLSWDEVQELHDQAMASDPDHDWLLSTCWCCCATCPDIFDVVVIARTLPDSE